MINRALALAMHAVFLLAVGWSAEAATLVVNTSVIPGLTRDTALRVITLRLTGPLVPGDAARVGEALRKLEKKAGGRLVTAELAGSGGDLREGITLGYLFRDHAVATVVRSGEVCRAACALAFLGGTAADPSHGLEPSRSLEPGARLGFDDPAAGRGESVVLERDLATAIARYRDDMGIPGRFVAPVLGYSSARGDVAAVGDLLDLEMCPTEVVRPPVRIEQQAANICNNATVWPARVNAGQVTAIGAHEARLHLLRHIHRNVETLGTARAFADHLAGVIDSRDRALVASTYATMKATGLPLPELGTYNYLTLSQGYAVGPYHVGCLVSLLDEGAFDIVLMGPKGLAPAARTAPRACPWLFRHDRRDRLPSPRT